MLRAHRPGPKRGRCCVGPAAVPGPAQDRLPDNRISLGIVENRHPGTKFGTWRTWVPGTLGRDQRSQPLRIVAGVDACLPESCFGSSFLRESFVFLSTFDFSLVLYKVKEPRCLFYSCILLTLPTFPQSPEVMVLTSTRGYWPFPDLLDGLVKS